jgi:hypothetical protein
MTTCLRGLAPAAAGRSHAPLPRGAAAALRRVAAAPARRSVR